MERIQELNGYFDFDREYSNFVEFLDDTLSYYKRADCLLYGGEGLITKFRVTTSSRRRT